MQSNHGTQISNSQDEKAKIKEAETEKNQKKARDIAEQF